MKIMRKICLTCVLIIVMACCSGCDEEFTEGLGMAKDIAGAAVKVAVAPDTVTTSSCEGNISVLSELLNARQGLLLKEYVAPDAILGISKEYKDLVNDPGNAQLNRILVDEIAEAVFDEKLDINYLTISDINFELKDMVDYGAFIRSHAVMTNQGKQTNVVINWRPIYEISAGAWAVYSIKLDE